MTTTTIDIVVAHCREPLSWLSTIQAGLFEGYASAQKAATDPSPDFPPPLALNLHVYEKCGGVMRDGTSDDDGIPRTGWAHQRQVYLENKGEECFAFLTDMEDTDRQADLQMQLSI